MNRNVEKYAGPKNDFSERYVYEIVSNKSAGDLSNNEKTTIRSFLNKTRQNGKVLGASNKNKVNWCRARAYLNNKYRGLCATDGYDSKCKNECIKTKLGTEWKNWENWSGSW